MKQLFYGVKLFYFLHLRLKVKEGKYFFRIHECIKENESFFDISYNYLTILDIFLNSSVPHSLSSSNRIASVVVISAP